jgi:hypothetical protein
VKSRVFILWAVLIFSVATVGWSAEWFTGSWEAEIGLSPQQTQPFSSFQTTLDVGLHLEFLEIGSISDFVIDGWVWQEFDLLAELGFVRFSGELLFDPRSGAFIYVQGLFSLGYSPLVFNLHGAIVGATQTESANYGCVIDIRAELLGGLFSFASETYLGADLSGITFTASSAESDSPLLSRTYLTDPTMAPPSMMFAGEKLTFAGTAYDCVGLTSVTLFTGAGFESESLKVEFLHLFGLPLNLGFETVFGLQTKSYVFTPYLETDYGCVSFYTTVLWDGSSISGLQIYGVAFEATIGGATFTSISNLDTTQYVITTPAFGWIVESAADALAEGHAHYPQDYWEVVSLVVDIPPPGSGFSFAVETFFSTSTGLLFDWAETTMGLTLALGSSVSTSSTITVDATGFTEWTLAFRVAW